MKNRYFLRETYTTPEKRDRINSSKINVGVDGFDSTLREFGFEPSEFRGLGKSDFFERMESELESEQYDEFVDMLFEEEGQKGDKFNLQVIELPAERDYRNVAGSANVHQGSRLDDVFDGVSNVLTLHECDTDSDFPSFSFRTPEKLEEVEADEELPIIIRNSDGEIEAEYSEGYQVEAPKRDTIEARVYPSSKLIAISNSGIMTGVQKDIARFVADQAEPIEESQQEVNENE